jgi:hypothetical protein
MLDSMPRAPLALHLACALPIAALAAWFVLIDRLPFGEGRCASCGVEGYVIAAHLVAAAWLGALGAAAAAARRRLTDGVAAPGRVTGAGLVVVAVFVGASLLWHSVFTAAAYAAMLVSLLLLPAGAIWWVLAGIGLWRHPPRTSVALRRDEPSARRVLGLARRPPPRRLRLGLGRPGRVAGLLNAWPNRRAGDPSWRRSSWRPPAHPVA